MIEVVTYRPTPVLIAPEQRDITSGIKNISESHLAGFVIRQSQKAYKKVTTAAKELGFQGDRKKAVSFNHRSRVEEALSLLRNGETLNPSLSYYGITQLHADGDQDDEMISMSEAKNGTFEILVFERGPNIETSTKVFRKYLLQQISYLR